jgi:protein tyrosine/serine phosphatase
MTRVLGVGAGTIIVIALIVGPLAFGLRQQAQTRNFRVVRDGVLYRSGQMTIDGLKRVLHDHGIKTVVCLRDGTTEEDRAEEDFCSSEEVNFVRIPPAGWGDSGGSVLIEAGIRKFKEVMRDRRNYPVLVHCFAGIHRTGAFTAVYRMEFENWSNERAIAEMKACGYSNLDDELDILGYMEQYRPDGEAEKTASTPAHQPDASARDARTHLRRTADRGPTLVTARYGSGAGKGGHVKPVSIKKRKPHRRPGGQKKKARPARPGAAARSRPGAA